MPVLHIDGEEDAVLVDDDGFVRNFAVDDARTEGETFLAAHFGVTALVDAAAVRLLGEELVNVFAVDFGAGSENFDGIDVGVLVDDASGNAVVLGVDQAERAFLVVDVKAAALAGGDGAVQNVAEKFTVDVCLLAERPKAPPNLGLGRVRRKTQKIAPVTVHFDGVAKFRVADDFVDSSAKDPRVVTQCGLFASGFQGNRFHAVKYSNDRRERK